jgi:hypothetical protein
MLDWIKCYNRNTLGHYGSVCRQDNHELDAVQMLQVAPENPIKADKEPYQSDFTFLNFQEHADKDDFLFHQREDQYSIIPDARILLDRQLTVWVCNNSKFLSSIRPSNSTLRVHTSGGTQISS